MVPGSGHLYKSLLNTARPLPGLTHYCVVEDRGGSQSGGARIGAWISVERDRNKNCDMYPTITPECRSVFEGSFAGVVGVLEGS